MKWHRTEFDPGTAKAPQARARKDVIVTAVVVAIGCIAVLSDPDRAFEWIAGHKEVQFDEFLTAVVVIGAGFAIFPGGGGPTPAGRSRSTNVSREN